MALDRATVPEGSPSGQPTELSTTSGEVRALALKFASLETKIEGFLEYNKATAVKVDALSGVPNDVQNLRSDIGELKKEVAGHFHKLMAFGLGAMAFLLVSLASGYFRLEDKVDTAKTDLSAHIATVEGAAIKTNTQLQDLLARVPPVQSAPRHY